VFFEALGTPRVRAGRQVDPRGGPGPAAALHASPAATRPLWRCSRAVSEAKAPNLSIANDPRT